MGQLAAAAGDGSTNEPDHHTIALTDSIITGDHYLRTLGDFQGIPIRTARQALAILDRSR